MLLRFQQTNYISWNETKNILLMFTCLHSAFAHSIQYWKEKKVKSSFHTLYIFSVSFGVLSINLSWLDGRVVGRAINWWSDHSRSCCMPWLWGYIKMFKINTVHFQKQFRNPMFYLKWILQWDISIASVLPCAQFRHHSKRMGSIVAQFVILSTKKQFDLQPLHF